MKVDIIAEIGINHGGDFDNAVAMIGAVAIAGVKIAKFQHYDALKLLGKDSPYLAYATKCQFTKVQHEELKQICDAVGLEYLVSVFDIADIPWADSLCKRHKVASRMNQNQEFIQALRDTGKEVIISINHAASEHSLVCEPKVRLMTCLMKYPTPVEAMNSWVELCHEWCGLSSHCPSIQPSLKAVAQGATLIEHHVCFDRSDEGCDISSSITFDELAQLNLMANQLEVV